MSRTCRAVRPMPPTRSGWLSCWSGVAAGQLHPGGEGQGGAGCGTLPQEAGARADRGIAATGWRAAGRRHQAGLGGLLDRHRVRAGDDRSADRRGTPWHGAGRAGEGPDARENPGSVPGPGGPFRRASRADVPVAPGTHRPPRGHDRRLDTQLEQMMIPFTSERDLLVTIPGIAAKAAAAIISEIGVDLAEFFTSDAHLASWTGLCPGNHESAGKRKHGRPHKGNQHIKPILVECAWSAVKTSGRLKARYHRLVLRFGGYHNPSAKKKAIVAIAHTLIVIIWQVLTTHTPYTDLGADFYTRRDDPERQTRRLIAKLQTPRPQGRPRTRSL